VGCIREEASMSEIIDVAVPDIGDVADAPVVEVYVDVGEKVEIDQTLVALESDKATIDVPSTVTGEIAELLLSEGDTASKGTLIARIKVNTEVAVQTATSETDMAEPEGSSSDRKAVAPAAPSSTHVHAQISTTSTSVEPSLDKQSGHSSPSVRRLARELGVELCEVLGSGRKGRITREDVISHVKGIVQVPTKRTASDQGGQLAGLELPAWPKVDFASFGSITRQPLSRIAKISGPSLARNSVIIPHVTNSEVADVTDLEAFRKALNAENKDGVKMSILPFVVKAVVAALKQYPKFNASLDGDELIIKNYFHIGIAVDTPDGLVVPVVKDADQKGVLEIAEEMTALAESARSGKLKASDMQGGTFTISSLGSIGGTGFTPIINAPEVAILGMTRASIQPVWGGEAFQPRLIQPLNLSWDHRVVDGVAAAKFLKTVQSVLTDFRRYSL
jgi:pyruvate dehydrogenase E2 component (dihydrolipoamide acetyltransferase)